MPIRSISRDTVNAICSFCSLDKEQKELIDKFGTSKEHHHVLSKDIMGVLALRANHCPFGIEIKR